MDMVPRRRMVSGWKGKIGWLLAVGLSILFVMAFISTGVIANPGQGQGQSQGNPGGGNFLQTTNEVESNHILAVTGQSGVNMPRLELRVYPTTVGPYRLYNPMAELNLLAGGEYGVNLGVENTVHGVDHIAGAMRFWAQVDATNRYDFEGAEFYVEHSNSELLEAPQLLGRLSTAVTDRFHRADFKLAGIANTDPEPEVDQIRPPDVDSDEFEPIWWEFRHDLDSRQRRTGIYPNHPRAETENSVPGHYHINYNIRSSNQEAFYTDNGYEPFIPGSYNFRANIFSAHGDEFKYTENFTVNGLAVHLRDELNNPIPEIEVDVGAAGGGRCSFFPESLETKTNEQGLLAIAMQPGQICSVRSKHDNFYNPVDQLQITPGGNLQDPVKIPARRLVKGRVDTFDGDGVGGYEIRVEPVGAGASERKQLLEENGIELETTTNSSGEYELELTYGGYELTAEKSSPVHYGREKGSSAQPELQAQAKVDFPRLSYSEVELGGIPEETIDWEVLPANSRIKVTVRKINSDGENVFAQRETVHLNGQTPIGEISKSGSTGVFRAEAVFEDLPRGTYRAYVTVTRNVLDGESQFYEKIVELGDDDSKNITLGP